MNKLFAKQCWDIVVGAVLGGFAGFGFATAVGAVLHWHPTSSITVASTQPAPTQPAAPEVRKDPKLIGTMFSRDSEHRLALTGIPIGVSLDDVMPACKGDPKMATTLCHGPLRKEWDERLAADVYGYKDLPGIGAPKVAKITITTESYGSTVIKTVVVHLTAESAFPAMLMIGHGFGVPSQTRDDSVSWDVSDDQFVILDSGVNLPLILLAAR